MKSRAKTVVDIVFDKANSIALNQASHAEILHANENHIEQELKTLSPNGTTVKHVLINKIALYCTLLLGGLTMNESPVEQELKTFLENGDAIGPVLAKLVPAERLAFCKELKGHIPHGGYSGQQLCEIFSHLQSKEIIELLEDGYFSEASNNNLTQFLLTLGDEVSIKAAHGDLGGFVYYWLCNQGAPVFLMRKMAIEMNQFYSDLSGKVRMGLYEKHSVDVATMEEDVEIIFNEMKDKMDDCKLYTELYELAAVAERNMIKLMHDLFDAQFGNKISASTVTKLNSEPNDHNYGRRLCLIAHAMNTYPNMQKAMQGYEIYPTFVSKVKRPKNYTFSAMVHPQLKNVKNVPDIIAAIDKNPAMGIVLCTQLSASLIDILSTASTFQPELFAAISDELPPADRFIFFKTVVDQKCKIYNPKKMDVVPSYQLEGDDVVRSMFKMEDVYSLFCAMDMKGRAHFCHTYLNYVQSDLLSHIATLHSFAQTHYSHNDNSLEHLFGGTLTVRLKHPMYILMTEIIQIALAYQANAKTHANQAELNTLLNVSIHLIHSNDYSDDYKYNAVDHYANNANEVFLDMVKKLDNKLITEYERYINAHHINIHALHSLFTRPTVLLYPVNVKGFQKWLNESNAKKHNTLIRMIANVISELSRQDAFKNLLAHLNYTIKSAQHANGIDQQIGLDFISVPKVVERQSSITPPPQAPKKPFLEDIALRRTNTSTSDNKSDDENSADENNKLTRRRFASSGAM